MLVYLSVEEIKKKNENELIPRDRAPTRLQAVEQSLTLECKCHGVSGSCSVRTCWRGLGASGPSAAGSRLLRRYATAAEVRPRSGGRLPPLYHHDNLLYTTKSPDYCLPDKRRGSLGTIGR